MRETKSPKEEFSDWKAPEAENITDQEQAEAPSVETPENLIEAIPENERSALRRMGEKIFGKRATEEMATSIRAQSALMKELGSSLKSDKMTWKGVDKKRAAFYAGYAFMGAMAAELGSPHHADAEEAGIHQAELMDAVRDVVPHTQAGELAPFDDYSESQRVAFTQTAKLLERFETEGGTPAQFEMQVQDIWDIVQELEGEPQKEESDVSQDSGSQNQEAVALAHAVSERLKNDARTSRVSYWAERIADQYEAQAGLTEEEIKIFDESVGTVEQTEGISARERVVFKEAALAAIAQTRDNPEQRDALLDNLIRGTELVQKEHLSEEREPKVLDAVYARLLEPSGNEQQELAVSNKIFTAEEVRRAEEGVNVDEELEQLPDNWWERADQTWTSEDGKITFAVGHMKGYDRAFAVRQAKAEAISTLIRSTGFDQINLVGVTAPLSKQKESGTYVLVAVPTALLPKYEGQKESP